MRALNASLIVLFATASSLVLSGCLGTNTPPSPPALINESASGTGFVATRGAGFEDMTTTIGAGPAINGATIGTDGPATFTAYTNSGTGAFGFIANLPADASAGGIADTAVLPSAAFTSAPEVEFPAKTVEANIATDTAGSVSAIGTGGAPDGGHILVDKFGGSQSLQDSEYGIWAENGTTGGLSATVASTVGAFAIGIPTTIMPTSGAATYTGGAAGIATSANGGGEFTGTAILNANFAVGGGTITGVITGAGGTLLAPTSVNFLSASQANAAGNVGTMNSISLNGGTIAGNTFTGTTSVGGAPAVSVKNLDISGATGTFGGTFNGLGAAEVAGTFNVTGGANGAKVIGAFGAKR